MHSSASIRPNPPGQAVGRWGPLQQQHKNDHLNVRTLLHSPVDTNTCQLDSAGLGRTSTIISQKSTHGQCILHAHQTGRWHSLSVPTFMKERALMLEVYSRMHSSLHECIVG